MKKKFVAGILVVCLLLALLPQITVFSAAKGVLKLGDFVYFGREGTRDKVWQIINTENDLVMLYDTELYNGEFDASFHGKTVSVSLMRYNTYGSATWEYSDVRQWLNARKNNVKYQDVVFDYNFSGGLATLTWDNDSPPSYSNKSGFLSPERFTSEEYSLIVPVSHVSLIPYTESTKPSVMDSDFKSFNTDLSKFYNGDYGISTVTDKVFLLNGLEFKTYVIDNGLYGFKSPTGSSYPEFWLRDSVVTNFSGYYYYYGTNALTVNYGSASSSQSDFESGIRAACCINLKNIVGITGDGTFANPYRIKARTSDNMEWNISNIHDLDKMMPITVYANQNSSEKIDENFILSDNTTASYAGQNFNTGENGFVCFEYDGGAVSIHKEDYVSRTFSTAALKNSKKIYLQQESEEYPVISGLWMEDVDIIHDEYEVPLINSEQYTVYTEISWGNKSAGSVKLMQGGASLEIEDGTATFAWSDYFDVTKDIEIVATSVDGKTSRKKLKLTAEYALPEALEGYKVDFGDSLSFTMPDGAGLLAGWEVGAGVYGRVPVEFSIEDGKIYAAIGFQKDFSRTDGKLNVKETTKSIKNFYNKSIEDATKSLTECWKYYHGQINKIKGSFGVDTGWTAFGFAEGYLTPEGEVRWLDGGMIIGGNASAGYSVPFYLGPVPMFFETKLSGSVESRVNLLMSEKARNFTPDFHLTGEVALSAGVGVGVKKVLSVSGGLKGRLLPTWDISIGKTNYFQLKASLDAYAKASVLFLEFSKDWNLAEGVWIEYPERKSALSGIEDLTTFDLCNTENYHPQDLSYLAVGSEFLPAGSMLRSAASKTGTSRVLVGNAYTNAAPQLAAFSDGTMLAVWVGIDESDTYNGLRLYASYFNGDTWSTPKQVDNDGTMDASPELTVIDDIAYLTWQNASKDISAITELDALANVMDIGFAAFDKEQQSFSVTHITDGNGNLDMMPQICGDGEDTFVVWLRNNSGDWFGNTSDNSIIYRAYIDGEWQTEEIAYSGLNSVMSLAADYDGSELSIAYSLDTDGDLNTSEDLEVYENGVSLTSNELIDSGVQYYEHMLYWYQNGSLISNDTQMLASLASDRYQFVNENGVNAIVYAEQDGLYTTVFASFFDSDSGKWGEPIALTDGTTNIASFSAAAINGKLQVLLNSFDVVGDYDSEEPYGTADLVLVENELLCDLSIEDVYFDASEFVDGADMTFDITVKNSGTVASHGITVTISDLQGNELSSADYMDVILSGESKEITCGFAATQSMYGQTVKITVMPLQTEDYDTENNSVTAEIDYRDIAVENMSWGVNAAGDTIVYVDIVNRSYANSSDYITVTLRSGNADAPALETIDIHGLDALSLQRVAFKVDAVDKEEAIYYVAISTDSNNDNLANDLDFVVLQTAADADCQHEYVEQITAPTCTEQGYTTHTCTLCGSSYVDTYVPALGHDYQNGVCTRCGEKDPNEGGQTPDDPKPDDPKPDDPSTPTFNDVPENAWFAGAVDYAVENGLMNGMGNNEFQPNTSMTRAMLVTVLWRYAGSPKQGRNNFSDIPVGKYYTDAVAWAAANGIVNGVGNGKFNPNGNITREQLVTILYRYCKQLDIDTSKTDDLTGFPDAGNVGNSAKDAMRWAVAEKLIGGKSLDASGTVYLQPKGSATRAEVATILMRFIENILK